MSRSGTRRPVQSALQRAAAERELRRSQIDELPALLRATLDNLPALAAVLREDASLGDVRSAIETLPAAATRTAVDVLAAQLPSLERQAVAAGIAPERVAPLAGQLEQLRAAAPRLPAADLRAATDAAYAAAEALEADVVDAVSRARAVPLTLDAIVATLRLMDLEVTIDETGGTTTICGSNAGGPRGEVAVDGHPPVVDASFEHPDDAVHPLHPEAGDPCREAIGLALKFHRILDVEMQARGLGVGRVETDTRPTRGAQKSAYRRRGPDDPTAASRAAS